MARTGTAHHPNCRFELDDLGVVRWCVCTLLETLPAGTTYEQAIASGDSLTAGLD